MSGYTKEYPPPTVCDDDGEVMAEDVDGALLTNCS